MTASAETKTTDAPESCKLVCGMGQARFIFINVFIVFFFSLAAVHISPPGPLSDKLVPLIAPVMNWMCWDQHWHMFAPSVRNFNEYGTAVIHFSDGSTRMQEFYRVDIQPPFEKWAHAKMRELWLDQLLDVDERKSLYPSISKYFAKAVGDRKELVPEYVSLGANWSRIPAPDTNFTKFSDLPQKGVHYTFFTYKVEPQDLP